MYINDPKTTSMDGKYKGNFYTLIGGSMESEETIEETIIREIFEETGLKQNEITLGPIVWYGEFDLILAGMPTHIKQKFIVAKTINKNVSLKHLTSYEKDVVEKLEWFSLEQIKNSKRIIYPIGLEQYLPDIITNRYPKEPIKINLN